MKEIEDKLEVGNLTWYTGEPLCGEDGERLCEGLREYGRDIGVDFRGAVLRRWWTRRAFKTMELR